MANTRKRKDQSPRPATSAKKTKRMVTDESVETNDPDENASAGENDRDEEFQPVHDDDFGRHQSEAMLSSKSTSTNTKDWRKSIENKINADEKELLELIAKRQKTISKQTQTYINTMTSFLLSLQPSTSPSPATKSPGKEVNNAPPLRLQSGTAAARSHVLFSHSSNVLQAAGDVLALYAKASRQIETLSLPQSPREDIAFERAKMGEVLSCGFRVAEAQLATVLGPRPRGTIDGGSGGDGRMKEDVGVERWSDLVSKLPGGEERARALASDQSTEMGGGVTEVVKDVKKGMRRMVKKLPFEIDLGSD